MTEQHLLYANQFQGFVTEFLTGIVIAIVVAFVLTYTVRKVSQMTIPTSALAYWSAVVHSVVTVVISWGLLVTSASFNMSFTYHFMSNIPDFADIAAALMYASAAINLSAGLLYKGTMEAYQEKRYGVMAFLGLFSSIILFYSLVAASSVLTTGDEKSKFDVETEELRRTALSADIKAEKSSYSAALSNSKNSAELRRLGAMKIPNANGAKVSLASHCKASSRWYSRNPNCQRYLDLKSGNSGNSDIASARMDKDANIAKLTHEIVSSRENQPTVMKAKIGDIILKTSVVILLFSLALELTILGVVIYRTLFLKLPAPPSLKTAKKSQTKPQKTRSQTINKSSRSGRSERSTNKNNDLRGVKDGSDNVVDLANDYGLTRVELALNEVFPRGKNSNLKAISTEQIHGLITELARHNATKPIIADKIKAMIKDHTGTGVGKPKVLDAMNDEEISDVVLIEQVDTTKRYYFRRVEQHNDASTENINDHGEGDSPGSSGGKGVGGLPTSRSLY